MKKILGLCLIAFIAMNFTTSTTATFTGKIIYTYKFTDLKGTDMTALVAPIMGHEQHWSTNGRDYKATDEKGKLMQLFISKTNTYYGFNGFGLTKSDAATESSKEVAVKQLDLTETIAGYKCKSVEIKTENTTTVFYYTPELVVNLAPFEKHNYGEWNKYLAATKGALPLKFVLTDATHGLKITATAKEVKSGAVADNEFAVPEGVK